VWWVTQDDIKKLRTKSDAEWLCEALGHPSPTSGQVYMKDDLDAIICNGVDEVCGECFPYRWDGQFKCPLIERYKLGDMRNPTREIVNRRGGFDYGDPAPCALTIGGRKGQLAFILYNDEKRNEAFRDVVSWADREMKRWNTDIFVPDPSISTKAVSSEMDVKGFAVYIIAENEKEIRVVLSKRIVERHAIIIPRAYWKLIESLRKAARDKKGKVRKVNDHSFDTFCYMIVDWGDMVEEFEGVGNSVFEAVLGKERYKNVIRYTEKGNDPMFKGIRIW
jgi:hypothetical protein